MKKTISLLLSLLMLVALLPVSALAETPETTEPEATIEETVESTESSESQSNKGQTNEGQTNEGQTGEGQTNEGQTGEGQTNEGQTGEGQTNEGQTNEGQTNEGQTGEGQTNEGQTGEGQTNEGQTNEGQTGEGQTGEGQTNEGQTGEGQTNEGQTGEGQTNEGQTGEGQTNEGQTNEGQTGEGQINEGQTGEGQPADNGHSADNGQPADNGQSADNGQHAGDQQPAEGHQKEQIEEKQEKSQYTISFFVDGVLVKEETVEEGKDILSVRPVDPKKEGFAFAYWYYVDSSTNTEIRVISGMCIDRNLQLFAKFIEDLQLQSAADEDKLEVKADDLIKTDGAVLSDNLVKGSDDIKDGKEKPKDVTVTITGKTWEIDYDGQHHEVASEFDITCDDPDFDIAALKGKIIDFLGLVTEKAPIDAGEYATGPDALKDDECNDDPNYYVSYKITQGTLKINQVAVTVSVTGINKTVTYNGDNQFVPGYELKIESDPSGLYDLKDTKIMSKVGTVKDVKRDKNGDVTFYPTGLSKPGDWNINGNFDVTYEVKQGEFWIMPATLTVTTGSAEDTVDPSSDKYLTCDDATYSGLQGKDEIKGIKCTGAQPLNTVGSTDNTFEIVWGDEKLAGNYTVEAKLGTLTVYGENVVIVDIYGGYGYYTYDGQIHTVEGFEAETKHHTYDTANIRYKGEKTLSLSESDAGEYYIELSEDDFENLDPAYEVTFVVREDLALIIDPCVVTVLISGKEYEELYTGSEIVKPAYEILNVKPEENVPFDEKNIVFKGENAVRGIQPGTYTVSLKEDMFSCADDNFVIKIDYYEELIVSILVITSPKVTISVFGNTFSTPFDGEAHTLTVKTDGKAYLDGVEQAEPPFTVEVEVEGETPFTVDPNDVYVRSEFSVTATEPGHYTNESWRAHLAFADSDWDVEFITNFKMSDVMLRITGEDTPSEDPVKVVFHDAEIYYGQEINYSSLYHVEDLPEGVAPPHIEVVFEDANGDKMWPLVLEEGQYTITGYVMKYAVAFGEEDPNPTYDVEMVPATLTVKKLPVTVTIKGEKTVLPYREGETQGTKGYSAEMTVDPAVAAGRTFWFTDNEDFTFFTEISKDAVFKVEGQDPGEYPMVIDPAWFTNTRPNSVDATYVVENGLLTIVKESGYRYTVELMPIVKGFETVDEIEFDNQAHPGIGVTVVVRDYATDDVVTDYPVTVENIEYKYERVIDSHSGQLVNECRNADTYQVYVDFTCVIRDANGNDVTQFINIGALRKEVTIKPRQLTVKIAGAKAEAYAGNTATASGYTLEEVKNGNFYGYLGLLKPLNPGGPISSGSVNTPWMSTPWYTISGGSTSVTGGPAAGSYPMGLGETILFTKHESRTNWDVAFIYEDGGVEVLPAPAEGMITIRAVIGPSQDLTYDGQSHQIIPQVRVNKGATISEEPTITANRNYSDRYYAAYEMTVGEDTYTVTLEFVGAKALYATENSSGNLSPKSAYMVTSTKKVVAADGTDVTGKFAFDIDGTKSTLTIRRFVVKLRLNNEGWATLKGKQVPVVGHKEYGELDSKTGWLEVLTENTPDKLTGTKLINTQTYISPNKTTRGYILSLTREQEGTRPGQNVGLYKIVVPTINQAYYHSMEEEVEREDRKARAIPNFDENDGSHLCCYKFEWAEADADHPDPTKTDYYYKINPAPLTIIADDKTKNYGEADPKLTYTVRGLIQGEKLSQDTDFEVLINRLRGEEGESGEDVGAYPILLMTLITAYADEPTPPADEKKSAKKAAAADALERRAVEERVKEEVAYEREKEYADAVEEVKPEEEEAETPWTPGGSIIVASEDMYGCGSFKYSNYTITTKDGVLKIFGKLTLTADSGTWVYDGAAHTAPDVAATGDLGAKDAVTAQATGTITEVGSVENPVGDYTITRDGKTTISYTVNKETKTESLLDYFTVTKVPGTLTVNEPAGPIAITITAASQTWTYDGTAHSNPEVTVTSGSLIEGDKLEAQATGSVTNVADTKEGNNPVKAGYKIMRGNKDVTDEYKITVVPGTLTIVPADITVTSGSGEWTYDGTAHSNSTVTVTSGSVGSNSITATVDGSVTNVSDTSDGNNHISSITILNGSEDVTANYNITLVDGTLTINPRTVTLTSASGQKYFDGTPITRNDPVQHITVGGDGFLAGEGATYNITGSQTNVGSSANAFTYTLNANTKAGNYKVTTVAGVLTVLPEEVPLGLIGSFSFYFISDTNLAETGKKADAYKDIFAWIKENNARLGALAIAGSGNAVADRKDDAAWKLIKDELDKLQRKPNELKYFNVAGTNEVNGDELDYATYSEHRLCEVPERNEYEKGQLWYYPYDGQQLLFVGIGYQKLLDPEKATDEEKEAQEKWLKYVNDVLARYPEYTAVLLVNDFIEHDPDSKKDDGRLTEFGELIEKRIVAGNDNVALVLCGSAEGTARWHKAYGERNVNAIMYNYQGDEENGLGFFRIITLNGEAKTITVTTYSPTLDKDSYDEDHPEYDFFVIENAF